MKKQTPRDNIVLQTAMLHTLVCLVAQVTYATDTIVPFIGADAVHAQGIHGQGVTVVVIDDGIHSDHLGLQGSIAGGGITFQYEIPFYDHGEAEYYDDHGTFVSLEITDSSGVAPAASILPVRIFGAISSGSYDDTVRAIKYAADQRLADPSIRIINMSLGGGAYTCPCDDDAPHTQELQAAISAAELSGILSFAASGNEAYCGYICAPARLHHQRHPHRRQLRWRLPLRRFGRLHGLRSAASLDRLLLQSRQLRFLPRRPGRHER